jgi:hypothetical protein
MIKLALLTMIRNESKRLKEWVEFHSKFYNLLIINQLLIKTFLDGQPKKEF